MRRLALALLLALSPLSTKAECIDPDYSELIVSGYVVSEKKVILLLKGVCEVYSSEGDLVFPQAYLESLLDEVTATPHIKLVQEGGGVRLHWSKSLKLLGIEKRAGSLVLTYSVNSSTTGNIGSSGSKASSDPERAPLIRR
jgi:hypothetical protein